MAGENANIDIAPYIDHTLLIPTATSDHIVQFCEQADRFRFAAVCIYPIYVPLAVERLHGKKPKICTVIGFPTGATTSAVKLYEAQEAAENGAEELDVVINIGLLKEGKTDAVHREIAEICEQTGLVVKVIIESTLLTDAEKKIAAEISMDAGAAFIKTSTGWNGGATLADVSLLKEVIRDRAGIKASGGIRTHEQAVDLIIAGATRLGTSRGIELLHERDNKVE
jgi:deoxyribose-phosphate aldolase